MVGDDRRKVKCNYCLKTLSAGVTRLKEHLAGIQGNTAPCTQVPTEIRKQIKAHMTRLKASKAKEKLEQQYFEEELALDPRNTAEDVSSDENPDEDQEDRETRRAMRESRRQMAVDEARRRVRAHGEGGSGGGSTLPPSAGLGRRSSSMRETVTRSAVDPYLLEKQSRKQPGIKAALKGIGNVKKHIGKAISKFFIFNHVPFNAANNPYYDGMVRAIQEGGEGVRPPTSREIAGPYLDEEVEETRAWVKTFEHYWDETGVTLMTDGWTTNNRRSIINFLAYCPWGTVFLRSVDATNASKTGEYIAGLIETVIEEDIGGRDRVVHVCTDNGANYKAAGR